MSIFENALSFSMSIQPAMPDLLAKFIVDTHRDLSEMEVENLQLGSGARRIDTVFRCTASKQKFGRSLRGAAKTISDHLGAAPPPLHGAAASSAWFDNEGMTLGTVTVGVMVTYDGPKVHFTMSIFNRASPDVPKLYPELVDWAMQFRAWEGKLTSSSAPSSTHSLTTLLEVLPLSEQPNRPFRASNSYTSGVQEVRVVTYDE